MSGAVSIQFIMSLSCFDDVLLAKCLGFFVQKSLQNEGGLGINCICLFRAAW